MGADWTSAAHDRTGWSSLKADAMEDMVGATQNHDFVVPPSNRTQDWSRGCSMVMPLRLLMVVDNMQVAQQATGGWKSGHAAKYRPYVSFLRWNLHALQRTWRFDSIAKSELLIQHRPRAQNKAADALANRVMDAGQAIVNTSFVQLVPHDLLVVSSDGGCRGNLGPGSSAACIHLYREGEGWILLAEWGVPLDHCTNVLAEFESACLGIRLLLLWCIQFKVVI